MPRLEKISILPLAKISSALHALVGFVLGMIVTIGSLTSQDENGIWSLGPWSVLVFPVVNAGLGFLTGAFMAWGYNYFAQGFGGIEFEVEEIVQAPKQWVLPTAEPSSQEN